VNTPQVSLVVSTIGRPVQLQRLISSLFQLADPTVLELVLVDQTDDQASANFLREQSVPFSVKITSSDRGLSLGRNTGLGLATAPLVAFPDDDCWYDEQTLAQAIWFLNAHPDIAGVSGIQLTEDDRDSMLRWYPEPTWITRKNFFRTAISSTLFLRTALVRDLGGFDLTLGAGSQEGFMSGEESDLVLRLIAKGYRLRYEPRLIVRQDEPRDELPPNYTDKMSGYGRGFGRLFADHELSPVLFSTLLGRKVAGAAVHRVRGKKELAAADQAFLAGAVAGYRGRR